MYGGFVYDRRSVSQRKWKIKMHHVLAPVFSAGTLAFSSFCQWMLPLSSKEAGAVAVPSLHSDLISGHSLESMSPVLSLQNGPDNSRVPDTTYKLASLKNWPGAIAKHYVKSKEVNVCLHLFLSRNLFFRRKALSVALSSALRLLITGPMTSHLLQSP